MFGSAGGGMALRYQTKIFSAGAVLIKNHLEKRLGVVFCV